jgi:hypothetical protein
MQELTTMRYTNYLSPAPTVDSFRLSHKPAHGLATSLVCPWVLVTGESGATYQFMRAYALPEPNSVVNFGAFKGAGELDKQAPLVYPFSEHPAVEVYEITEDANSVTYASPTHSLRLGTDEFRWVDANGRIDLTANLLGQPCTFDVPPQTGFKHPHVSRSHLARVTGIIDGDPVDGIWMHDHIYSTPGVNFRETEFTQVLHNFWMNWLVEYDDGTVEGGYAWRGRKGTGFAAAHHYVDGVSHARNDARLSFKHTERGSIETLTLKLGNDLEVEFEQHGSLDWPIHTYGTVKSISRDKKVVKSWNYSEQFPDNWGLVEEYQLAYAKLFAKYPSLQGLLSGAAVIDNNIVWRTPSA